MEKSLSLLRAARGFPNRLTKLWLSSLVETYEVACPRTEVKKSVAVLIGGETTWIEGRGVDRLRASDVSVRARVEMLARMTLLGSHFAVLLDGIISDPLRWCLSPLRSVVIPTIRFQTVDGS